MGNNTWDYTKLKENAQQIPILKGPIINKNKENIIYNNCKLFGLIKDRANEIINIIKRKYWNQWAQRKQNTYTTLGKEKLKL